MVQRIKELFVDEEGAALVEYALLVGLIACAAILAITGLGGKITKKFGDASTALGP